jgi:hypothetical protein
MTDGQQQGSEVPIPRLPDEPAGASEPETVDDGTRKVMSDSITNIVIELGRADSKAGILLGWVGAAVAILTTTASGRHLSVASATIVWSADAALATGVMFLLAVIRPYLKPGVSWVRYSTLDSAAILEDFRRISSEQTSDTWNTERVAELSRLAMRKYRRIRWAVDLLFVAGALLSIALLLAI